MNITEIRVGDRLVELASNKVAMTFHGFDFANPTTRSVDYSTTFKAVLSENNIITFGYANALHSKPFKPYRLLDCTYSIRGVQEIQSGLLVVQYTDDYFTLNIFNREKTIFESIEDNYLYELGYLTDGPYLNGNIEAFRLSTSGIVSPVIDWGVATSGSIQPDYYLPTWFYYELVMKSLQYTGLTLEGNIFTSTDFTDLVVPFSLDAWEYPMVFRDQWGFYAVNSVSTVTSSTTKISISNVIYQGSRNLYSSSNWQLDMPTVGATGNYMTYNFKASIRYTSTGSAGNSFYFRIIVLRSAVEITIAEKLETMVAPGGGNEFELSATVNLRDGDDVYVKYFTNSGTPTVTVTNAVFQGENTGRVHDNWVFFNYLLPDITMKDIVDDFTNRFGIVYRQVGGKLICKTLQEVISNKANAIDWSSKRSKTKREVIDFTLDYAQSNVYSYNSAVDDDPTLGEGYLTIDNLTLPAKDDVYTSIFSNAELKTLLFSNMGRIPVYDAFETDENWNQVNNVGGKLQIQINSVDKTSAFPVGSNVRVFSTNLVYNYIYAEVTAVSFSTNTLITLDFNYISAAGTGGQIRIVNRNNFNDSPGLRLMTLRSKLSQEQQFLFTITGSFRSDYRVAFFNDDSYSTKTTGWSYFLGVYYKGLSTALQKAKTVSRNYALTQGDIKEFNNHKILYDSGDYFLVRQIPNFVADYIGTVEALLIYPEGMKVTNPIYVYPATGQGLYTGFEPTLINAQIVSTSTGTGTYTGFAPTLYNGAPI